jgi:hypothetical protein
MPYLLLHIVLYLSINIFLNIFELILIDSGDVASGEYTWVFVMEQAVQNLVFFALVERFVYIYFGKR